MIYFIFFFKIGVKTSNQAIMSAFRRPEKNGSIFFDKQRLSAIVAKGKFFEQ